MAHPATAGTSNNGRQYLTSAVAAALGLLSLSPDRAGRTLASVLGKMAKEPNQKMFAQWMHDYLEPGSPGTAYVRRLGKQINPAVRKRFLTGFISGVYGNDLESYKRMQMRRGHHPAPRHRHKSIHALQPALRGLLCRKLQPGGRPA